MPHDRRVTIVLNWAELGGAQRRALMLARWLKEEQGAIVEVVALTEKDGRAAEEARSLGIPWRPVPVSWDGSHVAKAQALGRLTRALRRSRPDVLLPFCSPPNVLCGLVWRWTGASTCIWHQVDVNPIRKMREVTRTRAARQTPLFVSNSEHGAEFLVEEIGALRERVRVIRAGIAPAPPELTREEWRSRLGLAPNDFVASMVAHFHEPKDHATLLRAWRLVVDQLRLAGRVGVLLLAGARSRTQDAAKALAFDLRLDTTVRFLGDVGDVSGLIAASDVGVLSSLREGCPVSVIEYMAGGLPVVGTDIPGIREAVGPAVSPYLAPPGDAESLASAIRGMAGDAALRATLGQENRRLAAAEFGMERMAAEYTECLAEALANGGARVTAP